MRKWLLAATIIGLGGIFVATEVEARRIGGGRTVGAQRNVTAPPAQTPAKPAQQQNAQGQQQGAQPAAPARTPWGGILGGLALGGMLGYFLGSAGGNLLGLLLIAGLAIGAVMAFRAFAQRRTQAAPPVQFAGMRETVPMPMPMQQSSMPAASAARVPAEFDASGFLRAAKLNFLKLQAAQRRRPHRRDPRVHHRRAVRGAEEGLRRRSSRPTSVALDAELLELATEGKRALGERALLRHDREGRGAAPEAFTEVWNLVKPADGSGGWLLAGIQQMH